MSRELSGWLLQRLHAAPTTEWGKKVDQIFSFGGGGSGLSKEGWDLIHKIWSFDYMGAAEYEFGAVPKTLNALVQDRAKLIAFKIPVKGKDIKPNTWGRKKGDKPSSPKDTTVFALARSEHRADVERIVKALAKDTQQCKSYSGFIGAVDPRDEYDKRTKGWLDLSDPGGFFMFLDEDMWNKTRELFGVAEVVP